MMDKRKEAQPLSSLENIPGIILIDLKSALEKREEPILNILLSSLEGVQFKEQELLKNISTLIWLVDKAGVITYANNACNRFWGNEGLVGERIEKLFPEHDARIVLEKKDHVFQVGEESKIELELQSLSGEKRWMNIVMSPVLDEDEKVVNLIFSANDITELIVNLENLKYASMHDPLTGLYNRLYFEEEVRRLSSERHYPIGIISCDVDGLKLINDFLGHRKGDEVLKKVAQILRRPFRSSDVIARVGGDEFAVILPSTDHNTAEEICTRLHNIIKEFNASSGELPISISVGYASGDKPSQSIMDIYQEADHNMYKEKLKNREAVKNSCLDYLLELLERKEPFRREQRERFNRLAVLVGQALGLNSEEIQNLLLLLAVYDVGKVIVDNAILFKEDALNEVEWGEIKRHAEAGYRIAQFSPKLSAVAEFIMQHHEWWNGEGYPRGLKGNSIHLMARIIAVIDAYFAMLNPRPYRNSLSHTQALEELRKNSGRQFDPNLVDVFEVIIEQEYLMEA